MGLTETTRTLLAAKKAKNLTFRDLEGVVGRDEVWLAALFHGQASASPEEADRVVSALGLGPDVAEALMEFPTKGLGTAVPTDPFLYRFHEILQVYGTALKAVVQERFGDGIMSAVDLTLDVEKEEDPKGDRVRLVLSGKFLPYKKW
jgi:cyanate lyase